MGFKDDVRAKAEEFEGDLTDLKRRVSALENLANHLRSTGAPVQFATPRVQRVSDRELLVSRDPIDGASVRSRSTLDYGAIAFGLSEIKRKLVSVIGADTLRGEHQGAVDYFADVFAKADPEFNRDEFNRLAAR